MRNVITLLRLEFKNKYGDFSPKKFASWRKLFFSIIALALVVAVVYVGASTIFSMFNSADMAYEALVMVITAIFLVVFILGVSSTIKVLYYKGDNVILLRFPVSGTQIFVSKTLFLLLTQILIVTVVTVPFMIAYANVMPVPQNYAENTAIMIVFLVLIPFFLSNILAIPVMHITNKIRNKFVLIIIFMSLLMSAMFAGYMLIFDKIINYLKDSSYSVFSPEVVVIIRQIVSYFYPARYYVDIALGQNYLMAYLVLGGITLVTLFGTIGITAGLYQKTLLNNIEVEGSAFRKKTKMHCNGIFATLLHKEFIQIYRSVNYGFQYFVMACSMPVMVFFCNKIATNLGRSDIGDQISIGMTLLVMVIFMTVITSFAASSVSREGRNFYHTKVMPVSIRMQMFVKFFMYMLVSVVANIVCVGVLIFTKQMSWQIGLWTFGMVQASAIAITLVGMKKDIKKPQFNLTGDGEVVASSPSSTLAILFGFIIALSEGMISMILLYITSTQIMLIVCSAMEVAYLIGAILYYCINLTTDYNAIAKS